MVIFFFFVWALFTGLGFAGKPPKLQIYSTGFQTFYACGEYLLPKIQRTKPNDFSIFCTNEAAIATLIGCYSVQERNNVADTHYWLKQCGTTYKKPITYQNITEGYDYFLAKGIPLADVGNITTGGLDVPVIIPKEDAVAALDTWNMCVGNYNYSLYFGSAAVAYWGLICLLSGIANWGMFLFPGLRRISDGRVSRLWRKHVTLPALIGKKKAESHIFFKFLMCIVPSRLETLVIFGYFCALFVLSTVRIYSVKNNVFFNSKTIEFNRYVADRAGIMAITILPLLILFGGRNNFLMWLTRWNVSTFITFHRWISRFEVLLVFIHGVCSWRTYHLEGTVAQESAKTHIIWGILACFSGVFICFQGLLYLRRHWYEIFLVTHIILAAIFVIGAWYHVHEIGYAQFLYASFAVWAFDRVVRVLRILYFGFPKAEVSLFSDTTIKVKIPKPARRKPTPGGHAFFYFMHSYYFWQSHPFTYIESGTHVTCFCEVKTGITKSLHEHLTKLPVKSISMRVGVEGPYGESHPVKHHSDVVFIAGTNGMPGIFSEFQHLNKAADSKQNLKLKWVIREIKSFSWMAEKLERCHSSNTEITVHVTRPEISEGAEDLASFLSVESSSTERSEDGGYYEKDIISQLKLKFPHINFERGRPQMKEIVEKDIAEASNSVAFIVCATPQMVDEVRYQVVNNIDKTEKRVDFYDALEMWA